MKSVFAAVAVLAACVSQAAAEPIEIGQVAQGPVYYNRPHASLIQHDAELADCMAKSPLLPKSPTIEPDSGFGAGYGLAFDLIWSGPIAGLRAARVENCMLVSGWRAVRASEADAAKLNALPPADFEAAMAALVAAETPTGEIARVFANEAYRPGEFHTASRPKPTSRTHLSLKLFRQRGGVYPTAPPPAPYAATIDPIWPSAPIKLEDASKAPSGSALIVLRVTGISNRHGTGVELTRLYPDGPPPSDADHGPDGVRATIGTLFGKKEGNWFLLAVPPGRWRIAATGFIDFCHGAPAFEVKAGEVIYAGTIHIGGPTLGPDLDLAQARQYLGAPLADRVVPAVYRNGAATPCGPFAVTYALEFPGVPFDPAYEGGSVALARQKPEAAAQ